MDPLADHPNQVDKSPYVYTWNNPINLTDPDGRCPDCPWPTDFLNFGNYIEDKIDSGVKSMDNGVKSLGNSIGSVMSSVDRFKDVIGVKIWGVGDEDTGPSGKGISIDAMKDLPGVQTGKASNKLTNLSQMFGKILDKLSDVLDHFYNNNNKSSTKQTPDKPANDKKELMPTKVFEREYTVNPTTGAKSFRAYDTLVGSKDHDSFKKSRKKDSIYMSNH